MKLYTEEQVLKFINDNFDEGCSSINLLTPIELPSDEEIDEKSNFLFPIANRIGGSTYIAHKGFIEGAKWMRDKILNK